LGQGRRLPDLCQAGVVSAAQGPTETAGLTHCACAAMHLNLVGSIGGIANAGAA
jgi:hypothetical protein